MEGATSRQIALRFMYMRRLCNAAIGKALSEKSSTATPPLYGILLRVAIEGGGVSQQELSVDVGLDPAGISRLVAKMVDEELVRTEVDPEDRRRRLVHLTPKGAELEEELRPTVDLAIRGVVNGLTEEEEEQLLHLMIKATGG